MAVLEAVPEGRLQQLSAEARQVKLGVSAAGLVAAVLIGIGRLIGNMVKGAVWCTLAVREGYRDVRPPAGRQPARRDGGAAG